MRPINVYRAALGTVLATTFTGGLTAGLGMGFDLGVEWPSTPLRLVGAIILGSVEPVHRLLTVATGILFVLALVVTARLGSRKLLLVSVLGVLALALVALTGRMVLLVLGGVIVPPLAYLVYPLNNGLALLASLSMAVLASLVDRPRRLSMASAFRGAALWGTVASLTGAYMLGVQKIHGEAAVGALPPALSLGELPWLLHLVAGGLAVLLALVGIYINRLLTFWGVAVMLSAVAQPVLGLALYFGALHDPWAPGLPTALHTLFAHLLVISSAVLYLRARRAA